jgi:hypothetical protein
MQELAIREDNLINRIYMIRGEKVMLDFDLAQLYETETRVLKQAVRRNIQRFPDDFMFVLTKIEAESMVSQSVIPSMQNLGGALPFAFTEQGVAMLSTVLKSEKTIEVPTVQIYHLIFHQLINLRRGLPNVVRCHRKLILR